MNEPSKAYYFWSALFGFVLGAITIYAQYDVWLNYWQTGEIMFKFKKYDFECGGQCAVMGNLGFALFALCCLFVGFHACIKLFKK